jgi:hypothetical protein
MGYGGEDIRLLAQGLGSYSEQELHRSNLEVGRHLQMKTAVDLGHLDLGKGSEL